VEVKYQNSKIVDLVDKCVRYETEFFQVAVEFPEWETAAHPTHIVVEAKGNNFKSAEKLFVLVPNGRT